MANPFAQFDTDTGTDNPFAQFHESDQSTVGPTIRGFLNNPEIQNYNPLLGLGTETMGAEPSFGETLSYGLTDPFRYAGNITRAIPADIAAGISGQSAEYAGNVPAAFADTALPIDTALSEAAREEALGPKVALGDAVLGKISQGIAGAAPLAAIGGLPSIAQRGIVGGLTGKMIYDTKQASAELGTELGKPEHEQDPDKIAELKSQLFQNSLFAPLGGAVALRPGVAAPAQKFPATWREIQRTLPTTTEPIPFQLGQGVPQWVEPSGLNLAREPVPQTEMTGGIPAGPALEAMKPGQPAPALQPPAPTMGPAYQSGLAAQALREMAAQGARVSDFPQAVAEKVAQEQVPPAHPTKPLTENQLRIIEDSLNKRIREQQLAGPEKRPTKGLITGRAIEAWADEQLKGGGTHGGTDVLAAYVVKGAALLERGVINLAEWSAKMIAEHGEKIKPYLDSIYRSSQNLLTKGEQNAANEGKIKTGSEPEHLGTAQRENLQPNAPEIRGEEGAGPVSGNRPAQSGPVPEEALKLGGLEFVDQQYLKIANAATPANTLESTVARVESRKGGFANEAVQGIVNELRTLPDPMAVLDRWRLLKESGYDEFQAAKKTGDYTAMEKGGFKKQAANEALEIIGDHGKRLGFPEDVVARAKQLRTRADTDRMSPPSKRPSPEQPNVPRPAEISPSQQEAVPADLTVESVQALEPASGSPLSATDALINKLEAAGQPLISWADQTIKRSKSLGIQPVGGPELLAAYAIKGAELIGRGIKTFKEFSAEMIKEYGPKIKDQLDQIWKQAGALQQRQAAFSKKADTGVSGQTGAVAGPGEEKPTQQNIPVGTVPVAEPAPLEGESVKMRKLSERGTTAPSVPEPVQEKLKTDPESFYRQQRMPDVEQQVRQMSDAELAAVDKDDSNIKTAAVLELTERLWDAGKMDEGYRIFQDWSSELTKRGQVINQAKMLNALRPEHVRFVVDKQLKKAGYDPLTSQQAEKLGTLSQARITAKGGVKRAQNDWLNDPTDANAKLADNALKRANEADLAEQREIGKYQPKNWPRMLKAFAQGNPLTTMSHMANSVGNIVGAGTEAAARSIGSVLDTVRAAITGGERKLAVQPLRGTIEAVKGMARGAKQAPGILARGSGDVLKGEIHQQLQPLRAFLKAFAKNPEGPTVNGKALLNDRIRNVVEGLFGVAPEINLRLLSAADRPAYEAARSRLIAEQVKLKKIPSKDMAMAQKFPEMFFDRETQKFINDEAAAAIFQRRSKTIGYLHSLLRSKGETAGDWADLAFTVLVAPYRLVPWNLVGRTLSYHPLVAFPRMLYDAAKGNVRGAELNASRMAIYGMIYTAGNMLYKSGLLGPSLDANDELQKGRVQSGEVLPPNHVNISGLKRMIQGEDHSFRPGDETWDLTRGGGAPGAIMMSAANVGRDAEKQPGGTDDWVGSLIKNSLFEQANFTVNQSFLKGVTGLLDAVQNRNIGPYVNGVENMLLNVVSPNTLTSISRATREFKPDLSESTLGKEFENVIRNRFGFAGLDDYLPLKRDLWGKPMRETPEGRNALLYHFFDITKNKQVTSDPVSLELYDLWRRTGDTSVVPSPPKRTFTFAGKNYILTTPQLSRLAELVGQQRRPVMDVLVNNANFHNMPIDAKLKVIKTVYDRGLEVGKAKFWVETGAELEQKPKRAGFTPQ